MRPATSGLTTTPRRERKLPTAWVSSVSLVTSTFATSTDGGRPPPAALPGAVGAPGMPGAFATPLGLADALKVDFSVLVCPLSADTALDFGCCSHHAAPDAPTIPTTATNE